MKYGKALAAVLFAALVAAQAAIDGDNKVNAEEWVAIAIAVATAVGVYLVPLDRSYRWGKTAVAAVLAALQVLTTAVIGGVDPGEWLTIALAVLTALGVAAAPAVSDNGVSSKQPA